MNGAEEVDCDVEVPGGHRSASEGGDRTGGVAGQLLPELLGKRDGDEHAHGGATLPQRGAAGQAATRMLPASISRRSSASLHSSSLGERAGYPCCH